MHYGISKLGNTLFAKEAARRWGDSGVVSVSLHPGRVQTNIAQDFLKRTTWDVWAIVQKTYDHLVGPMSVEEGALTQLWAATAPMYEIEKGGLVNGGFYIPIGVKGDEGDKRLNNEKAAGALWEWMVKEFEKHGVDM
jgi:retinol dehydrogenase 12